MGNSRWVTLGAGSDLFSDGAYNVGNGWQGRQYTTRSRAGRIIFWSIFGSLFGFWIFLLTLSAGLFTPFYSVYYGY